MPSLRYGKWLNDNYRFVFALCISVCLIRSAVIADGVNQDYIAVVYHPAITGFDGGFRMDAG